MGFAETTGLPAGRGETARDGGEKCVNERNGTAVARPATLTAAGVFWLAYTALSVALIGVLVGWW